VTIAFLDAHPEKQKTDRNAAIEEILRAWKLAMAAAGQDIG
jgi:hypothetical protein